MGQGQEVCLSRGKVNWSSIVLDSEVYQRWSFEEINKDRWLSLGGVKNVRISYESTNLYVLFDAMDWKK